MQTTFQECDTRQQTVEFDGMPVTQGREKSSPGFAGADLRLDLRSLNEIHTHGKLENCRSEKARQIVGAACEYGFGQTGSGTGFRWGVTIYPDGGTEVLGVHTTEGLKKGTGKKGKKKRAKTRAQMNESDIERNIRRTKKAVRQKIRMLECDQLGTMTTRYPFVDAGQFKRVASRFFASMRECQPDFKYVAVFERHMSNRTSGKKYGSLHMHLATAGYVNYAMVLHCWRKAVQLELKDADYEGANIDFQRKSRSGRKHNSQGLSRYMSKYLTKDFDNEYYEPNKKRYWASKGISKPETFYLFSPPAHFEGAFREIWTDILDVAWVTLFAPEKEPGRPPIIWIASG